MIGHPKRIMIGYNVHFTSDTVVKVAIEHAKAFDACLYLVSSLVGHHLNAEGELADDQERLRLERMRTWLEEEKINYQIHLLVRERGAGSDLLRFAGENAIDEIVIGFKERSKIGEIVFGSNYRMIIARAPCPILTVHVREDEDDSE